MKPYGTADTKKEEVRLMFDSIARSYDRLNHLLSLNLDRLWRRKVAVMASHRCLHPYSRSMAGTDSRPIQGNHSTPDNRPVPDNCAVSDNHSARDKTVPRPVSDMAITYSILDMATGTADLAISLARRIPCAHITGVDISCGMVEIGRRKVTRMNLADRISLEIGDAEQLRYSAGSFDCVTAGFGVRNFQDIPAALSEMYRVLRRGGELYILEFSSPKGKIFGPLYRFYFHRVLPRIGGLVSKDGDAYKYLPASVDEFPIGELFVKMIEHAGFRDCSVRTLFGGVACIYNGRKI